MIKKLVLGGILGGIIVFAWGMVSWMVLPFHMQCISMFKDEKAVETTVMLNVDKAGQYMIPSCPTKHKTASPEAQNELKKQAMTQMEGGPVAYMVVNPKGLGPMWQMMLKGFLIQTAGAFLAVWLLLSANIKSYFGRYLFLIVFSVAVAILAYLPAWNWWGYPCKDTLIDMADVIIAYILAGLVIARVTK